MAKTPTERYGTRLAGWLGIFVATTVIFPAVSRLSEKGFGWPDVVLAVAGAVLLVFWAVRLVLLERARRGHAGSNKRSGAGHCVREDHRDEQGRGVHAVFH